MFGKEAWAQVRGRIGWLTVSVASSIPWPQDDVWVKYDGIEYLLHGVKQEGTTATGPCISTPTSEGRTDESLARLYRFTSVLGFYKRGFVDITGWIWGSGVTLYSSGRDTFTSRLQWGTRRFSCNHMPVIEDDRVRMALAFLREGRRLAGVHEPYAFLSFFKVIESQFDSRDRVAWVGKTLDLLADQRAVDRIRELRSQGVDVSQHLFESGRCAVAHANAGRTIVDPDIPADRNRIRSDLPIIEALANHLVKVDAGVPDEMDVFDTRDRLAPWHALIDASALAALKSGGGVESASDLGRLAGATVSVRLWPDPPAAQFARMTLLPTDSGDGVVKFIALSERQTIGLAFAMDVASGRLHTLLDEGGLRSDVTLTEQDIEDYTRYFHSVVGNRLVELSIEGAEPVDCEVVIPENIIPRAPEEAVAQALEVFKRSKPRSTGDRPT
ncbi:MAG: hypothetical protein JNM50_05240 [Chromatiales bacterium]|nr:hypothetical protein [Chromatiales bacterium]